MTKQSAVALFLASALLLAGCGHRGNGPRVLASGAAGAESWQLVLSHDQLGLCIEVRNSAEPDQTAGYCNPDPEQIGSLSDVVVGWNHSTCPCFRIAEVNKGVTLLHAHFTNGETLTFQPIDGGPDSPINFVVVPLAGSVEHADLDVWTIEWEDRGPEMIRVSPTP